MKYFSLLVAIIATSFLYGQFPIPSSLSTGQGPIGTLDPIWEVSPWSTVIPGNPVFGGIVFSPAYIDNNCAPGFWIDPLTLPSPLNTSNWITGSDSPCATNPNAGYRYFRLTLNLPSDCNGFSVTDAGSYQLSFSGYVDNEITDVFINGTSQGISGGSFSPGTQVDFTLSGPWAVGVNYIDVLIYNSAGGTPNPYGLLLVANNNNTDNDNDGVADINDACPCEPASGVDGCCPIVTVSNDTTVCLGSSPTLEASDNGIGNTDAMYTWSDGQTGKEIVVSPLVTTTYTVTLTDPHGCIISESITVTVEDNLTTDFTSSSYCVNDSVNFIDNSTVLNSDVIVIAGWDFGDGTQDFGTQVYHSYPASGTYVVTYAVITAAGCAQPTVKTIEVFDVPVASYSVSDSCDNTLLNFNDYSYSPSPIATWYWDFGDLSNGTNQNETHTYLTPGNFATQLTIVDVNGCKDTAVLNLAIHPTPQVAFSFLNGCLYDSVNFIDASTVGMPDLITTWNWDVNGDNTVDYTTQNATHKYSVEGDYNVVLSVTSNNNCSASLTETVSVYPIPVANFSASTPCVNGGPTQFVNNSTISSGNIVLNAWSFGVWGTSMLENPTHKFPIASSYPVTLGVLSDKGCADTVTFNVIVLKKPSIAFTQDTTSGCAPFCIQFTDNSSGVAPITNWNWRFESAYGESFDQNPSYCYAASGSYDVGLIITNAQGCQDTLVKRSLVTILPLPVSDFTLSPTSTDVLNPLIDFTNNSTDAATWEWNFGDGNGVDYSNYNPSYAYGDSGHFQVQLVVTNSYLCSDTSYQIVELVPVDDLFVPSAFSPNGDGKNDVLYARGYIGTMYFAVFDRLGKKVFETQDKELGWDGLINGKKAVEGVYTWFLQAEVNGTAYKLKGDVTLVR